MNLRVLRLDDFRLFQQAECAFIDGWNLLLGPNGAGKSSLIEAAFLLSHGRSFRARSRDALARHGQGGYSVFGEVMSAGRPARLGLARRQGRIEARIDGESAPIGDLMRQVAVVCFEPGSHELVSGPSDVRRRCLDWGVFHVEHTFLAAWRRYQKTLRQRNALLRGDTRAGALEPWDIALAEAAMPLIAMRARYFERFSAHAAAAFGRFLPELGMARFSLSAPPMDVDALREALRQRRDRDRLRGHTSVGPHRTDWTFSFGETGRREHLSRGQEKLCALALALAQAQLFAAERGEWPILCLDDLASEVDAEHLQRVLDVLDAQPLQILLTGTALPTGMDGRRRATATFHVEQGRIERLL